MRNNCISFKKIDKIPLRSFTFNHDNQRSFIEQNKKFNTNKTNIGKTLLILLGTHSKRLDILYTSYMKLPQLTPLTLILSTFRRKDWREINN